MSTGFSSGFSAGFNAVDSVLRQKDEKEQRERQNKREDERDERERHDFGQRKKAAELVTGAANAPEQGSTVEGQFMPGPIDQHALMQESRPVKLAARVGDQVLDAADPRAQDNDAGYRARLAHAYRQGGQADKALNIEELSKKIEKEGYGRALDHLFASGGDADGAQKIFDSVGATKLGGKLVATPTKRVGKDGVEIPDFDLSVVDANGNVVKNIGSAIQARYMADNPTKYIDLLRQEGKDAQQNKREDERTANDKTRADAAMKTAEAMEKYRSYLADLARTRANAGGKEPDQSGVPPFEPMSASDEKTVREFLSGGALPEGADINVVTDIAARIRSANRGMSLSEAAALAATKGVQIRNVNTSRGVLPGLVVPDREVDDGKGGKRVIPGGVVLMAPGAYRAVIEDPAKPSPAGAKDEKGAKANSGPGVGAALLDSLVTPSKRHSGPKPPPEPDDGRDRVEEVRRRREERDAERQRLTKG